LFFEYLTWVPHTYRGELQSGTGGINPKSLETFTKDLLTSQRLRFSEKLRKKKKYYNFHNASSFLNL